ncbi:hypothetical protein [Paraburkholderia sp.]|uniref:hypothetical protein n=1 Tax=Paraburkholderia sp. TaxID=1926495 RepID=UPI002F3F4171
MVRTIAEVVASQSVGKHVEPALLDIVDVCDDPDHGCARSSGNVKTEPTAGPQHAVRAALWRGESAACERFLLSTVAGATDDGMTEPER